MLDKKIALMVKFEGFNLYFESLMACSATYKQAYEMTEDIYERTYNVRKYSSYESFMETRRQKLAKEKAKNTKIFQKTLDIGNIGNIVLQS